MKQTMTRRFYITRTPAERDGAMLFTYGEAVNKAKTQLEHNPEAEPYYIVEVKAIVQREEPKPPINVVEVIG